MPIDFKTVDGFKYGISNDKKREKPSEEAHKGNDHKGFFF
jgi:hypothetical protein